MAMTLGSLVTQVGQRVDDTAHRRFTAVELRTWINEGCREIARRSECLYTTGTVAVSAGTQTVTGPDDIVRIHHVTFTLDNDNQVFPLDYYDLRDMDNIWGTYRATESAYPSFYTTWLNPPDLEITLAPVPSSAGDLQVYYYRFPTVLSTQGSDDNVDVDLPTGWEDLSADYACAKCAQKDRKLDEMQMWMQSFTDRLKALMDTAVRYNDSPGQIMPDLHWGAMSPFGYDGGW